MTSPGYFDHCTSAKGVTSSAFSLIWRRSAAEYTKCLPSAYTIITPPLYRWMSVILGGFPVAMAYSRRIVASRSVLRETNPQPNEDTPAPNSKMTTPEYHRKQPEFTQLHSKGIGHPSTIRQSAYVHHCGVSLARYEFSRINGTKGPKQQKSRRGPDG